MASLPDIATLLSIIFNFPNSYQIAIVCLIFCCQFCSRDSKVASKLSNAVISLGILAVFFT